MGLMSRWMIPLECTAARDLNSDRKYICMSPTVILRKYSLKSVCLKYGRTAATWSVDLNAVMRGQTESKPRRSLRSSSSLRIRDGLLVT